MSRLPGALVALVVAVALLASGCTSAPARDGSAGAAATPSGPSCLPPQASTGPDAPASTGPGAPASTGPGAPASTAGSAAGVTGAGEPLPDLTLPCFVGGQPVRPAHLGTPTVINFWASYCQPCLAELPQIQRYADRAAGRVQVVGVITADPIRSKPQSVIDEFRLRFPMLYDDKATLQTQAGARLLPMTLLVDAQGRVVYRYQGRPLDEAALADLVQRHLGVAA